MSDPRCEDCNGRLWWVRTLGAWSHAPATGSLVGCDPLEEITERPRFTRADSAALAAVRAEVERGAEPAQGRLW